MWSLPSTASFDSLWLGQPVSSYSHFYFMQWFRGVGGNIRLVMQAKPGEHGGWLCDQMLLGYTTTDIAIQYAAML